MLMLMFSPLLQFSHVKEAVAVFSGQLKLWGQWKHRLIEVPQDSFHCAGILMAVVNVVIQTDELPKGKRAMINTASSSIKEWQTLLLTYCHMPGYTGTLNTHLGFFLMSSSWPTTCDTLVRTILKAISSSPMISNLFKRTLKHHLILNQ